MTILSRHHTLLKELQIADRCFVTSVLFVDDLMPAPPAEPTLLPRASRWCTLPPDEDEDMGIAVYASEISHPSEELDVVLRAVVDEQLAGVIIIPPDADCLYHPYDGGADIIAGSPQARDELVRSSTRGCRLIHEVCSRLPLVDDWRPIPAAPTCAHGRRIEQQGISFARADCRPSAKAP